MTPFNPRPPRPISTPPAPPPATCQPHCPPRPPSETLHAEPGLQGGGGSEFQPHLHHGPCAFPPATGQSAVKVPSALLVTSNPGPDSHSVLWHPLPGGAKLPTALRLPSAALPPAWGTAGRRPPGPLQRAGGQSVHSTPHLKPISAPPPAPATALRLRSRPLLLVKRPHDAALPSAPLSSCVACAPARPPFCHTHSLYFLVPQGLCTCSSVLPEHLFSLLCLINSWSLSQALPRIFQGS